MPDDTDQITSPIIEEGEITDSETAAGDAASVMDLSGLINNHISLTDRLKQETGKLREMLDSVFENDPTYQTHTEAVKEANRVRSNTKKQLLKMPQVADLTNRIQTLRTQVKEANTALSGYLQDYARITGSTTFETDDGQVREIVYTARLVKKNDFRPS